MKWRLPKKAKWMLLCILARYALSFSQAVPLTFQHLTVEKGLCESKASFILKDRYGYMWFGTGYNYRHHPKDPGSLGSDAVLSMFEDSRGRLWVESEERKGSIFYFSIGTGIQ